MSKQKLSQKEKNIFFAALLGGIVGGLLANFLVTSLFRFFDNRNLNNAVIVFLTLIFFFGFLIFLYTQIKPNKQNVNRI